MLKQLILHTSLIAGLCIAFASSPAQGQERPGSEPAPEITVYKNPSCGCCANWEEQLLQSGFRVTTKDVTDLKSINAQYAIDSEILSCHTAIVDGYVIEGHVPAEIILRLLKERPDIAGLAVPGMPIGAPGMEMQGREPQPYEVIAFTRDGKKQVYARQ